MIDIAFPPATLYGATSSVTGSGSPGTGLGRESRLMRWSTTLGAASSESTAKVTYINFDALGSSTALVVLPPEPFNVRSTPQAASTQVFGSLAVSTSEL